MENKEAIAERLSDLLGNAILDGSDRDIGLGDALGEEGIGLDSLALVQFLTAVEQEFGIEISVDVWSRIDQMTLEECAEELISASA